MRSASSKSTYWRGVRVATPFLLMVVPFGALFGVVGTEAGLNLAQVMGFSVLVIGGASQFAALQLMTENVPTVVVLASALAVNLRMAMYSAALAPHLGAAPLWQRVIMGYFNFDQTYAIGVQEYEDRPGLTIGQRVGFFLGAASVFGPTWYLSTLAGALLGEAIPPALALDFALPITFLALIGPALRTPAHMVAAGVSILLALVFAPVPYGLGLLLAAVGAMAAGAEVERRLEARR